MQGVTMVVVVLIASLTYQIGTNPPGVIRQIEQNCALTPVGPKDGITILSSNIEWTFIHMLVVFCTVPFSTCLTILLLLSLEFPHRNWCINQLFVLLMHISVLYTLGANGVSLVKECYYWEYYSQLYVWKSFNIPWNGF